LGEVRDILTTAWGPRYGWGIITQSILEGNQAERLIKTITSYPNSLEQIENELPTLLQEAKTEIQTLPKKKIIQEKPLEIPATKTDENQSEEEGSLHLQAENALVRLGKATGCSVCIAQNDRNRVVNGKPIGEDCLKALPNFGLNEEATRRISLIDIIWIIKNSPICAFEVETTTSIYSGLLRMSDLLSVVPSLKISLYIVAPKNRQDKVMSEITRPTFQKIGLNEFCKFVPLEELSKLLSRIEGLQGHLQPTIIDTIATGIEDEKY
jgi:hypothetical protein